MPRRPDLARRAALARAAGEVLRARGTQTSMRALAGALGVKRPTLYFYFPDHASAIAAMLEPLYAALDEAVVARFRDGAHLHPIDRLRAVIDAALGFFRDRPLLIAGLVQRWALGGEVAAVFERERRAALALRDALVADLRIGIARREVRPCDPERVVELALACVAGSAVQHALGIARGDDARDELVRRVLDPLRAPRKRRRGRA